MRIALGTLCTVIAQVWRGSPVEALRVAARRDPAHPHLFWVVSCLASSLCFGLLASAVTAKTVSTAAGAMASVVDPFGLGGTVRSTVRVPFGVLVLVLVLTTALVFGQLMLRAVTIRWTLALRGARATFRDAVCIVATATPALGLVAAVGFVAVLFPGAAGLMLLLIVLGVGGLVVTLVCEIVLYIGLNRHAHLERSPLVPHAWLTVAFVGMSMVGAGLLNLLLTAAALS